MPLDGLASGAPHLIERLERFRNFTMAHPRLVTARDELMDAIDGATPGSLVLLLGPTGVGKTTLRMNVQNLLLQKMMPLTTADPSRLPFVSVEVPPPHTGRFRWRDYFSRLLAAMDEPLIHSKSVRVFSTAPTPVTSIIRDTDLSYAAEQALRYRRPPVVFVDEAQHLARVASGRRLSDQLDVIKAIANRTGTVHVLLGTYELLAFRNLSAQLSRRCLDLHFPRYRADSAADRQVFQSALLTFQKQLPFDSSETDPMAMWEFLYERSIGCVGILKEWLVRACVRSIRHGVSAVTREHLDATALSISQCEKILAESREGETRLDDSEDARLRFRTLLGIEPRIVPAQVLTPTRRNVKVGQRSPQRDPIRGESLPAYG
jgi:energy-coupling factor transporter ATP-binding protein EcfA2